MVLISLILLSIVRGDDLDYYRALIRQNSKGLYLFRHEDERGYSMATTQELSKGEVVLVMDGKFVISTFDTFPLMEIVEDAPMDIVMMVRLLYEKHIASGSFISTYISSMPAEHHCFGNWTVESVYNFRKECAFERGLDYPFDIDTNHQFFLQQIENRTDIPDSVRDFNEWKWAACIVTSRSATVTKDLWKRLRNFRVEKNDELRKGKVILPLFDLVNHQPVPLELISNQTSGIIIEDGAAYIETVRDFKPYQEFGYSYTAAANNVLLALYGFVLERNIHDAFLVTLFDVDMCRGFTVGEYNCQYLLQAYEVNKDMLEETSNKRGQIGGYRKYREMVKSVYFKKKLKDLREMHSDDARESLKIKYLISEHLTWHQHMKVLDRELLSKLMDF